MDTAAVTALADELLNAERGLMVCGPQDDPGFPQAVARVSEALGFPVLADPLSQVLCGRHHAPTTIDSYDAFLRDQDIAERLAPDVVLRFGAAPVSKPLLQYLQRHGDARHLLVDAGDGWRDPLLVVSDVLRADARWLCEALVGAAGVKPKESRWLGRWQNLNARARAALSRALDATTELSEPAAAAMLGDLLPEGATLFAGNSMPVRDVEAFLPGSNRDIRVLANRGASGIDGVVSTALGVSAVGDGPLVLFVGDLSFYHDMNGLLAAKRHGLRATIILLNNDGGGIFSFLPQADEADHFEELFGTPHGLDFSHAAELYGVTYRRVDAREDYRAAVLASIDSPGVDVIEVCTDRRENAALHRSLWEAVSREVRDAHSETMP